MLLKTVLFIVSVSFQSHCVDSFRAPQERSLLFVLVNNSRNLVDLVHSIYRDVVLNDGRNFAAAQLRVLALWSDHPKMCAFSFLAKGICGMLKYSGGKALTMTISFNIIIVLIK